MGPRDNFYSGYRQPYYPADHGLGLQPQVFDFKFTHANYLLPQEPKLELSVFKHGNYATTDDNQGIGKIPVVTMPGCDMPGFILRPIMGGSRYHDQVIVMNRVTWVDPVDYIVLPLLARYLDPEMEGLDTVDWSGESSVAGTQLFDYINHRLRIGVGFPDQLYNPWHYNLLRQVDGVANGTTTETVRFPLIWPPYDTHVQEATYNRRRNCKVSQQTICLAVAQLELENYDETFNAILQTVISLNVAQIQQEIIGDALYVRPVLYVLTNGVIYDDLQWYIG